MIHERRMGRMKIDGPLSIFRDSVAGRAATLKSMQLASFSSSIVSCTYGAPPCCHFEQIVLPLAAIGAHHAHRFCGCCCWQEQLRVPDHKTVPFRHASTRGGGHFVSRGKSRLSPREFFKNCEVCRLRPVVTTAMPRGASGYKTSTRAREVYTCCGNPSQ